MKTSIYLLTFTLALAAVLFGAAASVHAQTVITFLPYTISSSGTYVLDSNLNGTQTSGNLITVTASNVTIDFQGHYIAGPVGNTSQNTIGIYAYEQSNLTLKNGTIAYCRIGIDVEGDSLLSTNSVDQQISDMRVTNCYLYGINIYFCPASRITNCQVSQTGFSGASFADGISVNGPGTTISNCVVSNVTAVTAHGIDADTGDFVRQNTISNCTVGVNYGKYQDNLTYKCATAFSNGIDAGGNN